MRPAGVIWPKRRIFFVNSPGSSPSGTVRTTRDGRGQPLLLLGLGGVAGLVAIAVVLARAIAKTLELGPVDPPSWPPMHPTLGRRLTAGLASSSRFGELPVLSALHVGDGGTLRCHVQREVLPGTWGVHRVEAEGLSAIGAVREGSTGRRASSGTPPRPRNPFTPSSAMVSDTPSKMLLLA